MMISPTPRHVVSIDQFESTDISRLFQIARTFEHDLPKRALEGRILACLFYEPSTRTSSSFIAAMTRLGGSVIPITQGVEFSSVAKGESLEDTIVTLGQYADAIVLRHKTKGTAAAAASVSPVPIINAGDGEGEHPTQALLDLYTIEREFGSVDGLRVALVGDLKNGRTVHSLAKLLLRYDVKIDLVSPDLLRMPAEYTEVIKAKGGSEWIVDSPSTPPLGEILRQADVVYMTRVQRERFTYEYQYNEVKNACLLTPDVISKLPKRARVLHPLPRVNEIPSDFDGDPRATYFRQVKNGLTVRMALLADLLGGMS